MNDGALGTNSGDSSTSGMSTSLAADANSCSQQETLRVYSPSSDRGLHEQHAKAVLEGRFSLSPLMQTTEFRS